MSPCRRWLCTTIMFFFMQSGFAADNIVNIYTWSEEIPHSVVAQFEKESGIRVNVASYDSNEIMYAKLRASKNNGYDLIEPSSYYVDRMRRLGMLTKLDKTKLPNFRCLDPQFLNQAYDPQSSYSIPFIFGITGIFVNKDYFQTASVRDWKDLFDKKYLNQLMFLDDAREVFSMALQMLGYSINDSNPEHIKQAYYKLKALMPNVKLFNSDATISILIDEDATVGMSWNGDLYKANRENNKLAFIYPEHSFEIWVDNFALLNTAPHPENAYKFLNYLLRPEVAKSVSLNINYSTTNLAARNMMPAEIRNNPALYPPPEVMAHGEYQTDIGDSAFALFEKYWEQLKIGG